MYYLKREDLENLERHGKKSADNIIQSIRGLKKDSPAQVVFALGITDVGEITAKNLSSGLKTLENIMKATEEELLQVEEVGEKIAGSIILFFRDDENKMIIEKLKAAG